MVNKARFFRLPGLLALLLIGHHVQADSQYRLVMNAEVLPEIGLLSPGLAEPHKTLSGARHSGKTERQRQLVERLGVEFNGVHRLGVLRYLNMKNQGRYGIGIHYVFGKQSVDAIVTRAGMLVKTEYRKMQLNLGYRAKEGEDAGNDPVFYLAVGATW